MFRKPNFVPPPVTFVQGSNNLAQTSNNITFTFAPGFLKKDDALLLSIRSSSVTAVANLGGSILVCNHNGQLMTFYFKITDPTILTYTVTFTTSTGRPCYWNLFRNVKTYMNNYAWAEGSGGFVSSATQLHLNGVMSFAICSGYGVGQTGVFYNNGFTNISTSTISSAYKLYTANTLENVTATMPDALPGEPSGGMRINQLDLVRWS